MPVYGRYVVYSKVARTARFVATNTSKYRISQILPGGPVIRIFFAATAIDLTVLPRELVPACAIAIPATPRESVRLRELDHGEIESHAPHKHGSLQNSSSSFSLPHIPFDYQSTTVLGQSTSQYEKLIQYHQ